MRQAKDLSDQERHHIQELLTQFTTLGETRFESGRSHIFVDTKIRTNIIKEIGILAGIPPSGGIQNRMQYSRWNATINWLEENGFKKRRYTQELRHDQDQ